MSYEARAVSTATTRSTLLICPSVNTTAGLPGGSLKYSFWAKYSLMRARYRPPNGRSLGPTGGWSAESLLAWSLVSASDLREPGCSASVKVDPTPCLDSEPRCDQILSHCNLQLVVKL